MGDLVQDLTLKIYDAVADPALWQPALDQLVDACGAQGSLIFEWDCDERGTRTLTAPMHTSRYPPFVVQTYLDRCSDLEAQDQKVLQEQTRAHDQIDLLDDTLLAGSIDELRAQPHVQLLQKFGIFHRAAGILNKDNRDISLFSLQLSATRGPLTGQERALLSTLLPHMAKALDLSIPTRQLQARYRSVLSAMDQLTIGICVLDARGAIVARNQEFQRQQEAFRTFRVTANGHLRLSDERGQARLNTLMSGANAHGAFGARPRKEDVLSHTDDVLCVEVSPLRHAEEIGSNALEGFLVCSSDTSLPVQCNAPRIQNAFGLTPAETALIEPIGLGLTNPEIADRRGRSVATISAQTKSILAKSNCANRTQFVRMMMRFGTSFVARN